VTEYTSFLVLENDAEYQRWQIERRNLLRVDRDRQAQQVVRNQLERLREQALADLGPVDAAAKPQAANPVSSTPAAGAPGAQPASPTSRDIDFGGPSIGGGAIDPLSGGIALALFGLGIAARRRQRGTADKNGAA
jgi:Ca-activated chloride channel homolog